MKSSFMPLAGMLGLPSISSAAQEAAPPYRRPKLKITEIRTAEVRVHGYQVHIRVYTDQGIIGQGETTDASEGNIPLIRSFARMLVGQDPLNIEAAFERIRTSGIFAGAQSGQYVTALTGVETALWDIAGKALGLPVYQLLGGKVRDRVRVYCDSGGRDMIPGNEGSKARIKEIQDMGFTGAKLDVDDARDPSRFDRVNWTANNAEIDRMVASVAFTRESYGKNMDIAVDMHGRYDAATAKRVAKSRSRPTTSTPCATSVPPPKRPSVAARTFTSGGVSASCSKKGRWISSCPTSRNAAGCLKRARSLIWRTRISSPSRRIVLLRPSG
jgi:galactonate dehydratase